MWSWHHFRTRIQLTLRNDTKALRFVFHQMPNCESHPPWRGNPSLWPICLRAVEPTDRTFASLCSRGRCLREPRSRVFYVETGWSKIPDLPHTTIVYRRTAYFSHCAEQRPVSYTHLDVYKRQYLFFIVLSYYSLVWLNCTLHNILYSLIYSLEYSVYLSCSISGF